MTGRPTAAPFAVGSDGQHTVGYRSTDRVGNVETIKTVSFKVDNPILGTRQLGPSTDTLSNSQPEAFRNVAEDVRRRRPAERVPHQRDDRPSG